MTKQEIESFARSALNSLYDLAPLSLEPELAVAGVLSEIRELLYLNSADVLTSRHGHFAVPGVIEQDYEERFYDLGEGKMVLAGIRHLNGSAELPFVSLYLGFSPTYADLSVLKNFARENFKKFSPLNVSLELKTSSALTAELEKEIIPAREYIAGRIETIRASAKPSGYERIELQRLLTDIDYSWYLNTYADFHQKNPELKQWVPVTEQEELEKCASEGLLFQVMIDGKVAGIIGARSEALLGVPAVYMTELLLTTDFKKQNLAVALQRKFVDTLGPEFQLIWGTIDAKNLASKKTALRVGRVSVRAEYFIPLS
ncbi:hypothetical protein D3C87_1158660 [compost metagenome]